MRVCKEKLKLRSPLVFGLRLAHRHRKLTKASAWSCQFRSDVAILGQASAPMWTQYLHISASHLWKCPGLARIGRAPYAFAPVSCPSDHSESRHRVALLAHLCQGMRTILPAGASPSTPHPPCLPTFPPDASTAAAHVRALLPDNRMPDPDTGAPAEIEPELDKVELP